MSAVIINTYVNLIKVIYMNIYPITLLTINALIMFMDIFIKYYPATIYIITFIYKYNCIYTYCRDSYNKYCNHLDEFNKNYIMKLSKVINRNKWYYYDDDYIYLELSHFTDILYAEVCCITDIIFIIIFGVFYL